MIWGYHGIYWSGISPAKKGIEDDWRRLKTIEDDLIINKLNSLTAPALFHFFTALPGKLLQGDTWQDDCIKAGELMAALRPAPPSGWQNDCSSIASWSWWWWWWWWSMVASTLIHNMLVTWWGFCRNPHGLRKSHQLDNMVVYLKSIRTSIRDI